jgi:autotransporter-associated beta strand protein
LLLSRTPHEPGADASGYAQTIASLTISSSNATLNLGYNNLLTSTGTAGFAGTLNVSDLNLNSGTLMTYNGTPAGTFATVDVNGAPIANASLQLAYLSGALEIVSSLLPTWNNTASGASWSNSGNWTGGSPPASVPGASAIVGAPTTSQVTISLDIPQTLGSLTFTSSSTTGGYTLVDPGTNSLTMTNTGSLPAQINVTSGTHSIAASVMIAGGNLAVSASNYGQLTISGNIADDSLTTSESRSLTLVSADGTGELILSGTDSYAGGTFVQSGTSILTNDEALAVGSSLTIGDASAFSAGPGGAGSDAGAVSSRLDRPLAASPSITPVPEPGTLVLVVAGVVAGLATWRRRQNRGH